MKFITYNEVEGTVSLVTLEHGKSSYMGIGFVMLVDGDFCGCDWCLNVKIRILSRSKGYMDKVLEGKV